MKYLLLVLIFSTTVFADGAPKKTLHKTAAGKYPIWYAPAPGDAWTEELQADYDAKMDDTLNELCIDTVSVQRAQETIKHEQEVGKTTGFVDKTAMHDAGSVLVNLKPTVERLSKIVKDGTGKDASEWECP